MPALVPFIREGLARNEQFIYIADDQTVEELSNRLEEHAIDVATETRCGRLKLYTRKEWRQPGTLDSNRKAQQVRQYIAEAARAGFKGIRFAVEMTWTLGPEIDASLLEHWEATINTLFEPSFPGRIICQYNRSRLSPEALIAALHTHPDAVLGTAVYPNPFYQAPFILNGHENGNGNGHARNGKVSAARVDWMIAQLERARTAEMTGHALCQERAARLEAEAARKRAEVSEHRLRTLMDCCPEWVKVLDRQGRIMETNLAGAQILEADSVEEVIGRNVLEFIVPEDRPKFLEMHHRVCNGAAAHFDFKLVGLNGTRRLMETHAAPVPEPGGSGFLHLGITRDITQEGRSRAVSERLSAIVESSDDAIISKDLNGIIATWNQAAERIFGYTPQEAIGKPVVMLIPEDRQNEEPEILDRIRRGERIDHYETVRRRKDGALVDISLTISPVKDEKGNVIGASKIARDITARKRAEAELQNAREELALLNQELERRVVERTGSLTDALAQIEEFSYTVSHDLRAPARSMRGYAQVILDDFGQSLAPDAKDYLDRIIRGGERMDRLIRDVLTYSRLNRRELELQVVSLDRLVCDIINEYPHMQPPCANITIRSPLLDVRAHETSLAQAISNLLTNAIKFVPDRETPRVIIRTEARPPNVRLWVEDNGIGIKPEHQPRIFGVFERLPGTTQYEGTGIGLAIVRKAAERMGGSVGVESDGFTGSRFWIELAGAGLP